MPAMKKAGPKIDFIDWYTEYDEEVVQKASKRLKVDEVELINWDSD